MNQQYKPGKMSKLAVTALVFSCIFFIPVLPLVGAVLGIIGAATIKPPKRGMALAITAIPLGLGMVFFIQGILAAIAIPAFVNYMKRAKTSEATMNVRIVSEGAQSYSDRNVQNQFPIATTDWTPAVPCCERPEGKCSPVVDGDQWRISPWTDLGMAPAAQYYYQYRYISDGETFEVEARGDLDCDGTPSSFVIRGDKDGNEPLVRDNELE